MQTAQDFYFSWVTPEYQPRHRTTDWYWAVGIIAVSAVAASVLLGNILFAILIVLGTATLLMFARQSPRELHIEVNKTGIIVDKQLYRYESIESFWVDDTIAGHTMLTLKSKRLFMPFISFPVPDELESGDLRDVLGAYVQEVEYTPPLSDKLMEYLGF